MNIVKNKTVNNKNYYKGLYLYITLKVSWLLFVTNGSILKLL